MADEYNKGLCDERHRNIENLLAEINQNIKTLFTRLNWFYALVIGSLAATVTTFISSCH